MGNPTKTLQYRYDTRGNRSALIDHDGGRFTYAFDTVNRITQVLNPLGDRTTYSYDNAGRRTLKKLANGTRASFTYDAAGNLTKLYNLKSTGAVISSFDYKYDKVGNRTAVLEAGGSRVTWSYDNAYQLTGEHRTGATAYRDTYTYDPAGNRLLKNHDGARTTYAYDAANQLTYSQDASGRTTFTFDADGNQQEVREPSGNRTTYAWDYENRMTSARLPAGIRNTMAYDADGLRVKLEESTGTKKFVWDDQNYLGETDASNDTQVVYTNEPQFYGNLVSQRRGSTSHWYHFDALGSTRQLTDASAVVSDTRLYDAWGNAVATTGSTVSPLRWVGSVGYYFDAQIGQYYVRARTYSPHLGNWLSRDPLEFVDGMNSHTYSFNSPVSHLDPSGLLTWSHAGMRDPACGNYFWSIRFITDKPDEKDGWIIQKVSVNYYVMYCDLSGVIFSSPCPNAAGSTTPGDYIYYEVWNVDEYGSVSSLPFPEVDKKGNKRKGRSIDSFFGLKKGQKTTTLIPTGGMIVPSTLTHEGEVAFVPRSKLPVADMKQKYKKGGGGSWSGDLYSTCDDPQWPYGAGISLHRKIAYDWHCCCDPHLELIDYQANPIPINSPDNVHGL